MVFHFAANLSMLFGEIPFPDRFAAAREAGFRLVEFHFPYEEDAGEIQARLGGLGLEAVLFNAPRGDHAAGELGTLCNPFRREAFRRDLDRALEWARRLRCTRINVLAGKIVEGLDPAAQFECGLENLAWAAPRAAEAGVTLLIEALNPCDFPGYLLDRTALAVKLVKGAAHPRVRLQYDVYHAQMMEGNLFNTLAACFAEIGHLQIADVPGRHQPGSGEINFDNLFAHLRRLNYRGVVGLEYRPLPEGKTKESLAWLARLAPAMP